MKTTATTADSNRDQNLRAMLAALRDETYERVRELRHEQEEDVDQDPGDEIDRARATTDTETHASLIASEEERLRFIDEALGRVEQGRYGICAGCREPIPAERLRALPFAVYCVECQQKRHREAHGWSDGGTIQPYDQQWTLPEEMEERSEPTSASEEVVAMTSGSVFAEGPTPNKATRPRVRPKTHPHKK